VADYVIFLDHIIWHNLPGGDDQTFNHIGMGDLVFQRCIKLIPNFRKHYYLGVRKRLLTIHQFEVIMHKKTWCQQTFSNFPKKTTINYNFSPSHEHIIIHFPLIKPPHTRDSNTKKDHLQQMNMSLKSI